MILKKWYKMKGHTNYFIIFVMIKKLFHWHFIKKRVILSKHGHHGTVLMKTSSMMSNVKNQFVFISLTLHTKSDLIKAWTSWHSFNENLCHDVQWKESICFYIIWHFIQRVMLSKHGHHGTVSMKTCAMMSKGRINLFCI